MQQPGKFNDDEIKARWQKAQGRINVRSASVLFILQCIFMQEPFFNCGFHFWLLILFYAIKRVVLGPSRSAQAVTAQSCCFEISVDHYGVSTKVNQNCRSPPRFTDGKNEFPCTERITAASQLPLARWPESCAGASGSAAAFHLPFPGPPAAGQIAHKGSGSSDPPRPAAAVAPASTPFPPGHSRVAGWSPARQRRRELQADGKRGAGIPPARRQMSSLAFWGWAGERGSSLEALGRREGSKGAAAGSGLRAGAARPGTAAQLTAWARGGSWSG